MLSDFTVGASDIPIPYVALTDTSTTVTTLLDIADKLNSLLTLLHTVISDGEVKTSITSIPTEESMRVENSLSEPILLVAIAVPVADEPSTPMDIDVVDESLGLSEDSDWDNLNILGPFSP